MINVTILRSPLGRPLQVRQPTLGIVGDVNWLVALRITESFETLRRAVPSPPDPTLSGKFIGEVSKASKFESA